MQFYLIALLIKEVIILISKN